MSHLDAQAIICTLYFEVYCGTTRYYLYFLFTRQHAAASDVLITWREVCEDI